MNPTLDVGKNDFVGRDLKCTACSGYLSILPIYHGATTGYLCGRCTRKTRLSDLVSIGLIQRAESYEIFAKYMLFPCHNFEKGCEATLKLDEVVQHEAECTVQLKCMFYPCKWQGDRMDLPGHFYASHPKSFHESPFTLTLKTNGRDLRYFTKVSDRIFFVVCYWDWCQGYVKCSVRCIHIEHCYEHKFYMFKAEVTREGTSLSKEVKDETQVIWRKPFNNTNYLNLSLRGMGHPVSSVSCTIVILRKCAEVIANLESTFKITPLWMNQVLTDLLSDFRIAGNCRRFSITEPLKKSRCPVCRTVMKPPIFICSKGHSICESCRRKVYEICPTCYTKINMRNFTLENVFELIHSS